MFKPKISTLIKDKNVSAEDISNYLTSINCKMIDLSGCNITEEDLEKLTEVVKNVQIEELNLTNNEITPAGAVHIASIINNCPTLSTLNLFYTKLSYGSVSIITTAVKRSGIKTLDLGYNDITATGAENIAQMLKESDSLVNLNLYHNKLGQDGAKHIASSLKNNTTVLQTLNIADNSINKEGITYITTMIENNNTLHTLNLSQNNIDNEQAIQLGNAIEKNISLLALSIFGVNTINEKTLNNMNRHLKINQIVNDVVDPNFHLVSTNVSKEEKIDYIEMYI